MTITPSIKLVNITKNGLNSLNNHKNLHKANLINLKSINSIIAFQTILIAINTTLKDILECLRSNSSKQNIHMTTCIKLKLKGGMTNCNLLIQY